MSSQLRGDQWNSLVTTLRAATSVVVVSHVNPDPDTLGSALALAGALGGTGAVDVQVSFDADPFEVPEALAWLPGVAEFVVAPDEVMSTPDCVVAVDCAAPDRLGRLLDVANNAGTFAVLDHHWTNPGFAHLNVVRGDYPATAAMVAQLVTDLGLPMTPEVAANLYAGLASDTGSFRFPGTTAETHTLAAQLHREGIDHADISRRLFANRPLSVARLAGQMMAQARYYPDALAGAGLIIGAVSRADRRPADIHFDEVESLVTDLSAVAEPDTAVLLKEDDHGHWRVSARSKGAVALGDFAASRGGGGHPRAAGYTAAGGPQDIAADLLTGLTDFLVGQ